MLLGNQGLVTQVNVKSSGNVVISPLSTSVSWATTGGMYVTSTGIAGSTSIDIASGNIVISTGNLGTITSLTSGTIIASSGSYAQIVETIPTHGSKTNPSAALTWSSGLLTTIVQTISAINYTKSLTWSSGVLTNISVWSS